ALAAKSLKEAQLGTVFAAFLKVLLPVIVVVPGIAAFVLGADIAKPDEAYPWVLNNYVTVGFKGLAFAALIAAIGSSLSSMVNSASTIFTLDIYKTFVMKSEKSVHVAGAEETGSDALSEQEDDTLVRVGKIAAALSLVVGILVAPLLGNLDQAFQYIQEYTGFISPGIVAIFIFGMFWKRTSANAAFWVVVLSIPLSAGIKFMAPEFPFIDRMGLSFVILSGLLIVISLLGNKAADPRALKLRAGLFKTSTTFNLMSVVIVGLLAAIYALFW
ncbi:MAG: sodium transporter, partial [Saprospiraceae bacterium]|nr:sodium transporter [Saprospiraceae bacterium]